MKLLPLSVSAICLLSASGLTHGATLLEIYEKALDNDPELAAARAALEAGREDENIGRSALLPQLSANASHSESESESERTQVFVLDQVVTSNSDNEEDGESTTWSVSLQQPLFDMEAWYSYLQGGVNSEAAAVQFKADQQDFILRVATAYFDVLRAIDTLETAQAEEEALESQLEQTRQRYEVGLTAITDVDEVQAQYDSAVAATLNAEGNLAIAYESLEVLTGEQHDSVAPMGEDFPVESPEPADRTEWVDYALENNHSLETAQLNSELAELTAKSRRSAHLPTLSASLNHQGSDTTADGLVTSETPPEDTLSESQVSDTSITLDLNVPIFSGGRVSAQRRQAYHESMQAEDSYRLTRRETVQLARSAHLAVETGVSRVEALRQAIVSAESALEATEAGYEVGTRTLVDVLLAQRTLYESQLNYYDALYSYILDTLRLKQAAGILSPEDVVDLNQWLEEAEEVPAPSP